MGWSRRKPSRFGHIVSSLLIAFLLWGCTQQDAEPEPQSQQEQSAEEIPAIDVPDADTVDVIDDERNVERRIQDASIATRVKMALVDARDLRQFNFDPVVVNGQVQLQGEVNTRDQRSRAEAIAGEVSGVRGVTNEVTALQQPVTAEESPDTAGQEGTADSGVAAAEDDAEESEESTRESASEQTASASEQEDSEQEESETYHTVRSGESLWTISRSYGVSIDQIRSLNDLTSNSLRPGQRLRVK